mgnify:CR=1 FL=1
MKKKEYPVFLIKGFLDSGKTRFIRDAVIGDGFAQRGDTLVFLLEEGEEELTEITIPEGVTKIRNSCFHYYDALKTVSLPSTLTSIGASAFSGCSSLENIELPNNLIYLYPRVFEDCVSLKNMTIPASVEVIEQDAFLWCSMNTLIVESEAVIIDTVYFLEEGDNND